MIDQNATLHQLLRAVEQDLEVRGMLLREFRGLDNVSFETKNPALQRLREPFEALFPTTGKVVFDQITGYSGQEALRLTIDNLKHSYGTMEMLRDYIGDELNAKRQMIFWDQGTVRFIGFESPDARRIHAALIDGNDQITRRDLRPVLEDWVGERLLRRVGPRFDR